jgi:beta-lactamase regulating signal transducer with metallopeptidase domain
MNLLLHSYPGDAAVEFAGRIVVEIGLVIGLATLPAVVALRRRPAARHALWLGVLVAVAVAPLMLAAVERTGWMWSVHRPVGLDHKSTEVPPPLARKMTGAASDASQSSDESFSVSGDRGAVAESAGAVAQSLADSPFLIESTSRMPAETWRSLASVGTIVWLAGAIFLLARLLRGDWQVRRLLSDGQPVALGIIDESLEIAVGTLGVRRLPPIIMSPIVAGPVVAGLIRPTVVLPVGFVKSAEPAQLADVLIHECAHVLRHDTWVGLAQRLVQLVFWPHPLIYFMNRSLSRAREEVCDNYVLRRGDAIGYAQSLLELAEYYARWPTPASTQAIFSPKWKLEDRVAGLLDPHRQSETRFGGVKFLALVALLVAGGSALAAGHFDDAALKQKLAAPEPGKLAENAFQSPPAAEQKPESPANQKILRSFDKPTTVEFLDLALEDALQYVSEYHGIAVRRDRDSIKAAKIDLDHPVTVKLTGVPLRSVLQLLLEPLSLATFVDEGELVVTTREKAISHLSDRSYSVPHQLADVVRAGIPLADLGEVITQTIDSSTWQKNGGLGTLRAEGDWLRIRQRMDVRGHLDSLMRELQEAIRDPRDVAEVNRLETKEYSIANLQKLKFADSDILQKLDETLLAGKAPADGSQSTATINGDRLILTQPKWIHASAESLFDLLDNLYKNEATRDSVRGIFESNQLLSVEARRRIIGKCLAQTIPVNFVKLSIADCLIYVTQSSTPINFHLSEQVKKAGISLNSPVSLKAENEPLASLLDKLLVPLKLDWYVVDPDVLVVTTRADAAGRLEPRVYRTAEILAAGQTEKGLMGRIASIEPDSWAALGGPGQMRSLPGVLIVAHNRRVHEQITRLLASLTPGQRQPAK